MEPSHYTKSGQPALEELTGEYEPWTVWLLVGKPLMQALARQVNVVALELSSIAPLYHQSMSSLSFLFPRTASSVFPRTVTKSLTCQDISRLDPDPLSCSTLSHTVCPSSAVASQRNLEF